MPLFSSFSISGSALTAEKFRMDVIADNLANINTTRAAHGGAYRRRTVVFAQRLAAAQGNRAGWKPQGVKVCALLQDNSPGRMEYDPEHPDADAGGFVEYPNVDLAKEMTDLITSLRSYEANVTAVNTAKSLYLKALEIGRG